jgi:hypothetical protein
MSTYLSKNNQQYGPYNDAQIQAFLHDGTFSYEDKAWRDGMPEWLPLRTIYPPPIQPPPAQISPPLPPSPAQPQSVFASPIVKYGGGFIILLCLALFVGFILIISGVVTESPQPKAGSAQNAPSQAKQPSLVDRLLNNPDERAKSCAKTLVLKNIKAPSTATFPDCQIVYSQHPWYQVSVLVDAQNSFGAYIRSSFVCTIELGEGDKFSYMPGAGIQELDESMIQLGGVLEGIRAASHWPGANKDESK